MEKTILRILFTGSAICFCFFVANAAPTVKKLGTQTATSNIATVKANTATSNRAASVRFDTSKAVTSTPKKVSTTDVDSTRMLPSSKYLQVAHSVKPTATTGSNVISSPGLSSEEIVVIKDRITAVEDDMKEHVENTEIHVTDTQKEIWNEKQDHLTAGDGIKIEDNVVSSIMKLPVGSEDAPRTAPIWVE